MNKTQQCRAQASWSEIGTTVYTLQKLVYRIPCTTTSNMVERLGAIKKRSDGRWDYWRFKSKSHPTWFGEGQGTVASQGAAELMVVEGWIIEDELQKERMMTPEQGCTLSQILSGGGPWPTYVLKWGEDMPPDVLKALKEGEAALVIKDDCVISMVVYNDIIGMREMSVKTMRELNQRSRYV